MNHILSAAQFDRTRIENILRHAKEMEEVVRRGGDDRLRGKVLATLFYEPSTRTRLSHEAAMLRLGGQVVSQENASVSSSATKGETIEDTIRIVEGYADVIVMRHPEMGAAARAAAVASVPIINAGDGPGEHPTQSLLDLYTMKNEVGKIDGVSIALVGDLKYGRTVRSLTRMLAHFSDIHVTFVSPLSLGIGEDIKAVLREKGIDFNETDRLEGVLDQVDVLYMTRVQQERFTDRAAYEQVKDSYILTRELAQRMKSHARILHPLPRVHEIAPDVDADPHTAYFRQAHNGLVVRMALLDILLIKGL